MASAWPSRVGADRLGQLLRSGKPDMSDATIALVFDHFKGDDDQVSVQELCKWALPPSSGGEQAEQRATPDRRRAWRSDLEQRFAGFAVDEDLLDEDVNNWILENFEKKKCTKVFGGIFDFSTGLESLIGAPDPQVFDAMRKEHWDMPDSTEPWTTEDKGITTTSRQEWTYVVESPTEYPRETKQVTDPSRRRVPVPLDVFETKMARINESLTSKLILEELIAMRLYTGCVFEKYSLVLRAVGPGKPQLYKQRHEHMCRGNLYATTIHAVKSGIVKLGRLPGPSTLFRVQRSDWLPSSFWKRQENGYLGGVEFGFCSVTANKEVALMYLDTHGEAGCLHLFRIQRSAYGGPADLAWFSQYPHEAELTFPPLTGLEVLGTSVSGNILILDVRASISDSLNTIDMYINRRKNTITEMVRIFELEICAECRALQKNSEDLEGAMCEFRHNIGTPQNIPAEQFNDTVYYSDTLAKLAETKSRVLNKIRPVQFETVLDGHEEPTKVCNLVAAFVVDEAQQRREGKVMELSKFGGQQLIPGRPELAALGINKQLRVQDQVIWAGMGRGLQAMEEEIREKGTEEDLECFEYIVNKRAGSLDKKWPHSGHKVMDHFDEGVEPDGRVGQTLDYFVNHTRSKLAGLLKEHVVALRLYTTAAYKTINDPLRQTEEDSAESHPLPVTVAYLSDGIKRLRAVQVEGGANAGGTKGKDFWRGMRNRDIPMTFKEQGGTELAPMSTSSKLKVALSYSNNSERRLLFKVMTEDFMDTGADVQFLSAFPGEAEYLYPPMTFLRPTGRREEIQEWCDDELIHFTIVEVSPRQ